MRIWISIYFLTTTVQILRDRGDVCASANRLSGSTSTTEGKEGSVFYKFCWRSDSHLTFWRTLVSVGVVGPTGRPDNRGFQSSVQSLDSTKEPKIWGLNLVKEGYMLVQGRTWKSKSKSGRDLFRVLYDEDDPIFTSPERPRWREGVKEFTKVQGTEINEQDTEESLSCQVTNSLFRSPI